MNPSSFDRPIIRYFGVGGAAAIVDLLCFQALLLSVSGLHYLWASTISFLIATWVNYHLGIMFIFKQQSQYDRHHEVMLVYLVSFLGLCVHHSAFFLSVEKLHIPLLFGKIIGMGFAFFWNFSARQFWIFRK